MSQTRSRTLPLVMLGLIAHALFVSYTHHHGDGRVQTQSATIAVSSSDDNGSTTSNSEADCLSCRLQRNFNSFTQPGSTVLEILQTHVNYPVLRSNLYCHRLSLILSTRAPPLA